MADSDKIQDEQKIQDAGQASGNRSTRQRQIRFIEDGVKTNYAGVFNIGFGSEEVVFIFGNPSIEPNTVRIESKVAVSLKTAKLMAVTLGNLIRRYETANGVIEIAAPGKAAGNMNTKIQ